MACTNCNFGLSNTGLPAGCVPIYSHMRYIILVPTYDSEGNRNKISKTDTLNAAFLTAKINHTDPSKRWYPISKPLNNATAERAEATFEESEFQDKFFIREGIRTANLEIWGASVQHVASIDSAKCVETSIFIFDKDLRMIGVSEADSDDMYPIRIAPQSLSATWNFAGGSTTAKGLITFDFHTGEQDGNLYSIDYGTGSGNYSFDVTTARGLLDVYAAYSSITTDGFTVELYSKYGGWVNKITAKGLLLADVTCEEVSPIPATVTLASFDETEAGKSGVYEAVFTTPQTAADVLKCTFVKNGFDFTFANKKTFEIPA